MGGCKTCKCVKAKYRTNCGDCGKMKIKLPKAKPLGLNKNLPLQAITTTTTTILQLASGSFSFDNVNSGYGCHSCCGYNNTNTTNSNIICLSCEGLYNVTALIVVDTAPVAETVTLALDINGQQFILVPLIGSGTTIPFSTNLNLCATDKLQFRIYASGAYTGNVTSGNVSVVKVSDRIGCH